MSVRYPRDPVLESMPVGFIDVDRAWRVTYINATLAYMDMTMTCLKCHQYTRDNKTDARLPVPQLPGTATAVR